MAQVEESDFYARLSDLEKLKFAALCDDLETAEEVLQRNGSLVHEADDIGRIPIFWNIEMPMFELFLKYGSDVNSTDRHGRNIIQFMLDHPAEAGRVEKVMLALDHVEDQVCLSKNYQGMTLLHYIREMHNIQSIEYQSEFPCKSCKEYVCQLLQKGVSVNAKDVYGRLPMNLAVFCGCIESIRLFLNAGVTISVSDSPSIWEHMCAASPTEDSFEKCLDFLLMSGYSINYSNNYGNALHTAATNTSPKMLKWLLKNNVDINCLDAMGNTPLHNCVKHLEKELDDVGNDADTFQTIENDTIECVSALVGSGIDVNQQNKYGFTALHYATDLIYIDSITVLVQSGADVNIRAFTGETPLHRAVKEEVTLQRFIDIVSESRVDFSLADKFGSTPLHWSVMFRNWYPFLLPSAKRLLNEVTDDEGRKPDELMRTYQFVQAINVSDQGLSVQYLTNFASMGEGWTNAMPNIADETMENDNHQNTVLDVIEQSCEPDDPFCRCVLLQEISTETDMSVSTTIRLDDWMSHVEKHRSGIRQLVDLFIDTNEMGLVQNLAENGNIRNAVYLVMREFAQRLTNLDPVLECEPHLMGSYREGTKVFRPCEFDYVFRFAHFNGAFEQQESADFPGFVRLKLKTEFPALQPFVDANGFLDATKLVPKFYTCCNSVLLDADFMKSVNLYPCNFLDLDAFSIDDIELRWVGPTVKDLKISVDIVPAFGLDGWIPNCVSTSHLLLKDLPTAPDLIAVLKTQNKMFVKDWATYLRASVATLEIAVMERLPLAIKKGYILVKALCESNMFPQISIEEPGFVNCLTTYMVKCSFFREVEAHFGELPDDSHVEIRKTSLRWAGRIVERIKQSLERSEFKGFFMPSTDFLRAIDDGKIDDDKRNVGLAQCKCLKKMLDIASKIK